MKKHYYLIRINTTVDRNSSIYKKICETYEEAESEVMNYADWWSQKGTCTIVKVDSEFNIVMEYRFWKGKLAGERIG
jgi:hypothetical protein